jgi:hypothetical protein
MYNRWFSATVLILWLAMMGWLVKEKVLPLLLVGEPPSVGKVIEAQRQKPVVGWRVSLGNRPLGWALEDTKLQPTGLTEVHGRVHFDTLPLDEMVHAWLQPLSRLIGKPTDKLQLDARSVLTVDGLGHLIRFDSTLRFDPWNEVIAVHGTVEGGQVQLQVRTSSGSLEQALPLPTNGLLSDAFSPQPQTELPGLRAGQTWTVPVYSPLCPDKNKLEILRATVEETESIFWNGEMVSTRLVVYRSESGSGVGHGQKPRGRVWVRRDGTVLKQEAMPMAFGPTITFVRLAEKESEELAASAGRQWWSLESELRRNP